MDVESYKKQLLETKTELENIIEISKDSRKVVELDQTTVGRLSRMDAMQQQAMALANDRRREIEIIKIEQALKRIEADDFGYCLSCEEEIAPKRLDIDPAIATCINCSR